MASPPSAPSQDHPLQNKVILDILFKYLTDVADIKNARRVCTTWSTASLKQWRKTGVLVILMPREPEAEEPGPPTHSELLELMMGDSKSSGLLDLDKNKNKPFQKIKLKDWKFTDDELLGKFMGGRFGASIKVLHLDGCKFPNLETVDLLLTAEGALPALEKLVWTNSEFGSNDDGNDEETSIFGHGPAEFVENLRTAHHAGRTAFQHTCKSLEVNRKCGNNTDGDRLSPSAILIKFAYICPNLEEIIVRQSECHHVPCNHTILRHLGLFFQGILAVRAIHDDKPVKLRSLDIMDFFTHSAPTFSFGPLYSLAARLPLLERLSLDLGSFTPEQWAKDLFSAFAGTLKVLKAFRAPLVTTFYKSVPFSKEMSALTELHLWGNFTSDLEFLRFTPTLQVLVLKRDVSDKLHKVRVLLENGLVLRLFTPDLVGSTVTQLQKRSGVSPSRALRVEGLRHVEIDYNISAENIPMLASWLPNLTSLKMVLWRESLEAVSRAWPRLTELECLYRSRVEDDDVSCLLEMRALSKFKSNAYCGQGLFSSSSADRVFLGMKALEKLEICVSIEMSEKSEAKLARKISHVKIIRNYDTSDGGSHSHECCERIRFLE